MTTDKVDVEIPSPATGRVARIVVEAGDTVPVGETIAEIDSGAAPGQAHPDESQSPRPAAQPAAERDRRSSATNGEADRSGFYSPVVRRIADKHGVDLEQVEGTGIGGRVRKKDVLAQVENGGASRGEAGAVLHSESPYRPDEPARQRRARVPSAAVVAASGASRCRRCAR